ncbi:hypothetical protein L596_011382 [Steinernema carpocapsae]|uniref:Uncharacterized protein n=1 Tax=Steinernema carpocapsae TaxID=34508 RepID=A0A4U5NTQ6_STECR|nr:hypothetical protein L596_011382 [Steinernema carpocapsae]
MIERKRSLPNRAHSDSGPRDLRPSTVTPGPTPSGVYQYLRPSANLISGSKATAVFTHNPPPVAQPKLFYRIPTALLPLLSVRALLSTFSHIPKRRFSSQQRRYHRTASKA